MNTKDKAVRYRRCIQLDLKSQPLLNTLPLQDMLSAAEQSHPKPWKLSTDNDQNYHTLSRLEKRNNCLCGELVLSGEDKQIPLVDHNPDGTIWQGVIDPNDSTGKLRKLQEGNLFFAVRENHVAVIQGTGVKIPDLERFLTWFVEGGQNAQQQFDLKLQNLPSKSARDKLKDHTIKGFKIKQRLRPLRNKPSAEVSNMQVQHYQHLQVSPMVIQILRCLNVPDPIVEKVSKSTDPAAINVGVHVSYNSRSEKEGTAIMDALADLDQEEGSQTEILLSGNTSIKGDDLKIGGSISVQCPKGVFAPHDAMSKLATWLMNEIEKGTVV